MPVLCDIVVHTFLTPASPPLWDYALVSATTMIWGGNITYTYIFVICTVEKTLSHDSIACLSRVCFLCRGLGVLFEKVISLSALPTFHSVTDRGHIKLNPHTSQRFLRRCGGGPSIYWEDFSSTREFYCGNVRGRLHERGFRRNTDSSQVLPHKYGHS